MRGWDVLVIIAYGADDCARPESCDVRTSGSEVNDMDGRQCERC